MKIEKLAKQYGRAVANQVNYYGSMYGYYNRETLLVLQAAEFERISDEIYKNCLEPAEEFKCYIWGSGHKLHAEQSHKFFKMTPPGEPTMAKPKDFLEARRVYCDAPHEPLARSSYVFPEINHNLGVIWHAIWDDGDNTHRKPYRHWDKGGSR